VKPEVSVITLGVADLARAKRFYHEGRGWPVRVEEGQWVTFSLGDGSSVLALYPWDLLASDAGIPPDRGSFSGVTLAYVVRTEERVDEVLAEAERAGARIVKPGQAADWGGYGGYFADPDGHLWEVAKAEELPSPEDRR
jgi:uncharacterized protein